MTPFVPVNSSSNWCRSSANAVANLFYHQSCGTLSRFGVGFTVAAYSFDSRFLLRLRPDWECTSKFCLEFITHNCGWTVRLKSIDLACEIDFAIVLRLLLLTLPVLQLLTSKMSSACSRVIRRFSYLIHCNWGHQVDRPPYLSIRLHRHPPLLLPRSHRCCLPPTTTPDFSLEISPYSAPRGGERHYGLFGIVNPFSPFQVL